MWLSPVERCVRVAEVPGSNPGTPIVSSAQAAHSVGTRIAEGHPGAPVDRVSCSSVSTRPCRHVPDPGAGRRSARIRRHHVDAVRAFVVGAVAERLLHSPRKRASERTWGFESLPLREPLRSTGPGGLSRACRLDLEPPERAGYAIALPFGSELRSAPAHSAVGSNPSRSVSPSGRLDLGGFRVALVPSPLNLERGNAPGSPGSRARRAAPHVPSTRRPSGHPAHLRRGPAR